MGSFYLGGVFPGLVVTLCSFCSSYDHTIECLLFLLNWVVFHWLPKYMCTILEIVIVFYLFETFQSEAMHQRLHHYLLMFVGA